MKKIIIIFQIISKCQVMESETVGVVLGMREVRQDFVAGDCLNNKWDSGVGSR